MNIHAIRNLNHTIAWGVVAFVFTLGCNKKADNTVNFTSAINSYYSAHPACLWPERFSRLDGPPNRARALSVDNDDDARWLAQGLHRSFGSSVDVHSWFLRWFLLVVGARPVEEPVAQDDAVGAEH